MALEFGTISMADDGALNDIVLELETLEDTFEKAIARYEYPYRDGADLEDMGQKAHCVKVRCYFYDDGVQATYAAHVDLLNLLKLRDLLEFNHPKYGVMQGKVESVTVRHDERERTAEIDFSFVEQMRGDLTPVPAKDVEASAESLYVTSQDEQLEEVSYYVITAGLDPALTLTEGIGILAQLKGVAASAREYARELDAYLGMLDAAANEITQPVNSLTATLNFEANIPGRLLGTVTKCVERVARLYDATQGQPARYIANLDIAFAQLVQAAQGFSANNSDAGNSARTTMVNLLTIACATRLSLESAYCYSSDEQNRQSVRQAEGAQAFDNLGRWLNPDAVPQLMNARELEESLATVRTRLQGAIDVARGVQTLKTMALELLTHVSTVKLERERIITVEIDGPLPLHLICLKYGLPYNYAERIRSINPALVNPSFVSGTLQIYTLPGGAA
jgi:prophage DNA circulation protein